MNKKNKNVIIATGGTGGHIFPAVSLANYLNKNGYISVLTTDERGKKFIDKKFIEKIVLIDTSSFNKKKLISFLKILEWGVMHPFQFVLLE